MSLSESTVHEGNYYQSGVDRIVAELRKMGIAVPEASIKREKGGIFLPPNDLDGPSFSNLDYAVMDRFEGRDYLQAQNLIHAASADSQQWHVIVFADVDDDVSNGVILCPSLYAATAVTIEIVDREGKWIDQVEQQDQGLIFYSGGLVYSYIRPVEYEPYSVEIRDRVRNALKHLRRYGNPLQFQSRFQKLPGFSKVTFEFGRSYFSATEGCLLLGYAGNWSVAMKEALATVGIQVKLYQAQELVARFFGAASWHQLVAHQDDVPCSIAPSCVTSLSSVGVSRRYFRTTEEAIYATGKILEEQTETVVMNNPSLTIMAYPVVISGVRKIDFDRYSPLERYRISPVIRCGYDEVNDGRQCADGVWDAAGTLLQELACGKANPASALCKGDDALSHFIAAQERAGIRREHIVSSGEFVLCFDMTDIPGQRDFLHLHKFDGTKYVRIANGISLYKAALHLSSRGTTPQLTVMADYERETVAVIPIAQQHIIETIQAILRKSVGAPAMVLPVPDEIRFH